MDITLFESFLKVISEMRIFILGRKKSRESIFNAIEKIRTAADKTMHYYATMKFPEEQPNIELSDCWRDAASSVREIDLDLYNRLLDKANYWANPSEWTDQKIQDKKIYLDEIINDCNQLLRKKKIK